MWILLLFHSHIPGSPISFLLSPSPSPLSLPPPPLSVIKYSNNLRSWATSPFILHSVFSLLFVPCSSFISFSLSPLSFCLPPPFVASLSPLSSFHSCFILPFLLLLSLVELLSLSFSSLPLSLPFFFFLLRPFSLFFFPFLYTLPTPSLLLSSTLPFLILFSLSSFFPQILLPLLILSLLSPSDSILPLLFFSLFASPYPSHLLPLSPSPLYPYFPYSLHLYRTFPHPLSHSPLSLPLPSSPILSASTPF